MQGAGASSTSGGPRPEQQAAVAVHVLDTLMSEDKGTATTETQAALLAFVVSVVSTLAATYKDGCGAASEELEARLSR